jgi:hypothetical protein
MEMESEIHLTLGLWGFTEINHSEISEIVGLQPVKVHKTGERINPKFLPVAKENGWIYTHSKIVARPFEEQMNELISIIRETGGLKQLSSKYYCELSCAIFKKGEDESMPWIHLTKDHVQFLNEFNIEFDLDIYA